MKRALKARYAAYDGVADLYVYFFEQALCLLRPGGRFAFTVTNKWLKAGYAEELRCLLAEHAWLVSVTDFGHARGFFPGTDVFPSVICARRPRPDEEAPEQVRVTVVPRDLVRMDTLEAQVAATAFPLPRIALGREAWVLEPPEVRELLQRVRDAGAPLAEYAGRPYRGVLTGFNEAFIVDTPMRDRLVAADPHSAGLLKPLLRGQDIDRWASDWPGLWLIFTRHGTDIEAFPAIKAHLAPYREKLEPKPADWRDDGWAGRKPGAYHWWEIQDNVAYFEKFSGPKIIYQEIQYYPAYSTDGDGLYLNNKGFMLPSADPWLLAVLNSPLLWWFGCKRLLASALRIHQSISESQ